MFVRSSARRKKEIPVPPKLKVRCYWSRQYSIELPACTRSRDSQSDRIETESPSSTPVSFLFLSIIQKPERESHTTVVFFAARRSKIATIGFANPRGHSPHPIGPPQKVASRTFLHYSIFHLWSFPSSIYPFVANRISHLCQYTYANDANLD